MWYFTYDHLSNRRELMRAYQGLSSRVPLPQLRRPAVLKNHRIDFPVFSEKWSGGIASIASSPGKSVSGAVFDLPRAAIEHLDGFYQSQIDAPRHDAATVQKIEVSVIPFEQGPEFIAVTHQIVSEPGAYIPPSEHYLDLLLQAAADLQHSVLWIEQLRSFSSLGNRELLCRFAA